jgi:hypothetical protein
MADKTTNANQFALDPLRGPQRRITEIGMNALKPIMHLQVSVLRMWADSIERFAGNYEKGLEETATTLKEQADKERAA